jgi:uncharacterized membrane protein
MPFCGSCGAQLTEATAFCPSCGRPIATATGAGSAAAGAAPAATPVQPGTLPIAENAAGLLAYFTVIPAIVFLVLEPYNKNRFVRFHSFQCIAFNVAWIALWVLLNVVAMIPFLGFFTMLVWPLVGLGGLVLWIILALKAYQGQWFKMPLIGNWAEKQAGIAVTSEPAKAA